MVGIFLLVFYILEKHIVDFLNDRLDFLDTQNRANDEIKDSRNGRNNEKLRERREERIINRTEWKQFSHNVSDCTRKYGGEENFTHYYPEL